MAGFRRGLDDRRDRPGAQRLINNTLPEAEATIRDLRATTKSLRAMTEKLNEKGAWAAGAIAVSPGVWLYQLAGDGLALELTAKGTKYYRDDTLN
mgnify:CR=1 FL=1